MVKTYLTVVKAKLNVNGVQLAEIAGKRRAWVSDFNTGKHKRIHLDVIQRIIDYAKDNGVVLTIADFFIDSQ